MNFFGNGLQIFSIKNSYSFPGNKIFSVSLPDFLSEAKIRHNAVSAPLENALICKIRQRGLDQFLTAP